MWATSDMDVGWIHPWVGLGWVENFPVLVGWVGFIYAHCCKPQSHDIYLSILPAKYSHPRLFWKENAVAYPLLSSVARIILSISASSAQSKRDFSSVGRTITDARARLSAAKVEAIELVRWGLRASLISYSS